MNSLMLDVRKLARCEASDYLFLVRREKSYLFPIEDVYVPDSYAYLCWTAYTLLPDVPVDAFYLHVEGNEMGPRGTVVLLDYEQSAADVVRAAALAPEKRAAHVRKRMKYWQKHARICTTLEMVTTIGGDLEWT